MTVIVPDPIPPIKGLSVMRKQTHAYIMAAPTPVVLRRMTKVSDGAGGYTRTPTPQPEQVVRMIRQNESEATERRNRDGEVVRPQLVMMMEWDGNVHMGDQFDYDPRGVSDPQVHLAEVVWITDMNYELLCEVAFR